MRLFQCNIEGGKHLDRVFPLIDNHVPDVICLQEADQRAIALLVERGYETNFLPMLLRPTVDLELFEEGVVLAARSLNKSKVTYWNQPADIVAEQNHARYRETTATGYIIADCKVGDEIFTVAATHFTWTQRGEIPNDFQREDMKRLLYNMQSELPHILCGDFNIPRHHNILYQDLLTLYTDNIPEKYTSSLDKTYHRLGNVLSRSHLFTDFMVDYIFTTPGYNVSNVELHFGISDHAAVTASIYKV